MRLWIQGCRLLVVSLHGYSLVQVVVAVEGAEEVRAAGGATVSTRCAGFCLGDACCSQGSARIPEMEHLEVLTLGSHRYISPLIRGGAGGCQPRKLKEHMAQARAGGFCRVPCGFTTVSQGPYQGGVRGFTGFNVS